MDINKADRSPQIALKEKRDTLLTVTWAIAALVATVGWIYCITFAVWFLISRIS
jgi:hypothetical protein